MTAERGAQSLTLGGDTYVVMPRAEYERLTRLVKAAELSPPALPPLPPADAEGNRPAVDYGRASIARSIIRDRARLGLSQAELARRAGLRKETLCRIESGRYTPSLRSLEKIDSALREARELPSGPAAEKRRGRRKGKRAR
jgi:DNA-binding XRE family transcriptional regulator